jgi:phosphate transport system permease protein
MPKPKLHRFSIRPSRKKTTEVLAVNLFRLMTYCVILAAAYIFIDIAVNGSKAVFQSKAPFINTQFLTEKPQTLHVFEPLEPYNEIQNRAPNPRLKQSAKPSEK